MARQPTGLARSVLTLLALAVFLAVPATAPPPVAGAGLADQIKASRERAQHLADAIDRQERLIKDIQRDEASTESALRDTAEQLDGINADQQDVRKKIDAAIERLERVQARHQALLEELRQTDWTLGLLEQELASGEEDLKARRGALGQRLAEAYRSENTSLLEQVFTAESFSDVLSQASASLSFGDRDAQMAREIASDQQALDALRLLTTSTRLRTDQLRRATIETRELIQARKAELTAARKRLAALERKTKRIKEAQKQRYHEIVKSRAEAERIARKQAAAERALKARIAGLVRRAQIVAAQKSGVRPGSGNGFLQWPAAGTVTQEYGCTGFALEPPRGSCAHFHDGIDIANGSGTPIHAAADGVVAFVGFSGDGAFVVVMGHAAGYETLYGHLLGRYAVQPGLFVKKGRTIGYMGCTGYCTGTHLHWEVILNGQTVNPRSAL